MFFRKSRIRELECDLAHARGMIELVRGQYDQMFKEATKLAKIVGKMSRELPEEKNDET